jgi:site-specific recombinase
MTNESGLNQILEQLPAIGNISDRVRFFDTLCQWLARDSVTSGRYVRIRFLIQQLEKNPELKTIFKIQVRFLFKESSLLKFFLQTGFTNQSRLLQEIGRRVISQFIPSVQENDFYELFNDVFHTEDQLIWFDQIPQELLKQMISLFSDNEILEIRRYINSAATEALVVLTSNLAFLSLTSEIRERSKQLKPSESPFLQLQIEFQKMFEKDSLGKRIDNHLSVLLSDCLKLIDQVYTDMEQNGTSIGLVYRLEVMSADLERITELFKLFSSDAEQQGAKIIHEIFKDCAEATYSSESVVAHFHQQTHLLSRKIAERNGESGDHYIARDPKERRKLFYSALKGGVIVVLMTLTKLTFHSWHLPPLLDATCIWLIYSIGFLAMQFTDSTLATKLPSFTASKLARLMSTVRDSSGLEKITIELKTVLISQGLAFFGNILAVIPLALIMEAVMILVFKSHLLDTRTAETTLQGLNPLTSLALLFGIITGGLLWISSIAGGWFENWIVFRKIPEAIRHHKRMNRVFGKQNSDRAAIWIEHNASGISANIVLGFLFGFLPFIGTVTGLPLDSKHVTISSASAAMSALTLAPNDQLVSLILWASLGLVLIGIANLLVSFTLALIVAARASAIDQRRFRALIGMLGRRLFGR